MKNLIKHILKEETSIERKLLNSIDKIGVFKTSKKVGGLDRLYSIIDLKGTKEDMIFLIKSIMKNEAKEEFNYCSYNIVPTQHSIKLYVYIPKPLPEHEGVWGHDQSARYRAKELISMLLYKLGGGLIRGHSIYVYNTGDC